MEKPREDAGVRDSLGPVGTPIIEIDSDRDDLPPTASGPDVHPRPKLPKEFTVVNRDGKVHLPAIGKLMTESTNRPYEGNQFGPLQLRSIQIEGIEMKHTCSICSRRFADSISFKIHQKIHELKGEFSKLKNSNRRLVKSKQLSDDDLSSDYECDELPSPLAPVGKAPGLRLTQTSATNPQHNMMKVNRNKRKKTTNVNDDAYQQKVRELSAAQKLIEALCQKMSSLQSENNLLKSVIKKLNVDLDLGNVISEDGENQLGRRNDESLADLEDVLSQGVTIPTVVDSVESRTSPMIKEDGTSLERIKGGLKTQKGTVLANEVAATPLAPSNGRNSDTDVKDPNEVSNSHLEIEHVLNMDSDLFFEVEFDMQGNVLTQKKVHKGTDGGVGGSGTENMDPVDATTCVEVVHNEKPPPSEKKHSCGLCSHRTSTPEEMLEHMATHTEENNDGADPMLTDDDTSDAHQPSQAQDDETQQSAARSDSCRPKPKRIRKKTIKPSCDLCDYQCRYLYELNTHKYAKHNVTPAAKEDPKNLLCGVCDYKTVNKANMVRHIATHTGETRFACDKCDFKCYRKGSLVKHQNVHSEVYEPPPRNIECEYCSYAASTKSAMRIHCRRIHKIMLQQPHPPLNSTTYQCELCDKTFKHRGAYGRHKKFHDQTPRKRTYIKQRSVTCEFCFKKVQGWGPYSMHRKACQQESNRLNPEPLKNGYACRSCGVRFASQEEGMAHDCPQPQSYYCTVCGHSSKTRLAYTTHMRVHTGERPYLCKICGRRFRQTVHLSHHMLIHSGEKPYTCRYCGKAWANKTNMQVHERIHTGEAFDCNFCGFKARGKRTLKKHIESNHHTEETNLEYLDDDE